MDDPPNTPTITSLRSAGHGRLRLITLSDGRELVFSDEACERAELAAGTVADASLLEVLDAAEQRVVAHEGALRLLSHRARSEREMRTRLAMRGIAPEVIEDEVTRLREAGLLDDEQFARAWVEDRRASAPRGRRMLRYELLSRGIGAESVDRVTDGIDDLEVARGLALQKGRSTRTADYDAFLAKVGGFLRRRGFDYGVAAEATRTAWLELGAGPADAADEPVAE